MSVTIKPKDVVGRSQLFVRLGIGLPALALIGVALFRLTQYAHAERLASRDTVAALEEAAHIVPADATLYARIATLDPTRDDALTRALTLNPREPSWWIMRSLQQEQAGDNGAAEASLRQAVNVADYFVPWWSLTAFYYRQGNVASFIPAAGHTLSQSVDDPDSDPQSIFRMAANLEIPPSVVEQQILPRKPAPVASYLRYCLGKEDWPGAIAAGLNLARLGPSRPEDREILLKASEILFRAGFTEGAVQLWDAGIAPNGFSVMPIDPSAGTFLTDGNFTGQWNQPGLGWKIISGGAFAISQIPGKGVQLEFDGRQPEDVELFGELVPLASNRSYKLITRFRTHDLPVESGLRWVIAPVSADHTPPIVSPSLSSEQSALQEFVFTTPPKPIPLQIRLTYSRRPGTTRIKGQLMIESAKLEPVATDK